MSDYQDLLDELRELAAEPLTKANPPDADDAQDDADIKAAADGDADDDGEPDGEDAVDDYDDHDDEGAPFGKSFQVTLADGRVIEAIDGQEAIGAIQKEISALRDETRQALGQIAEALKQSTQLIKSLRTDNAELKNQMSAIGASGRGRKSTLVLHEKQVGGNPEQPVSVTPRELMVKALEAQRAGRISGIDVARLESYLGNRAPIPDSLLAQIGG